MASGRAGHADQHDVYFIVKQDGHPAYHTLSRGADCQNSRSIEMAQPQEAPSSARTTGRVGSPASAEASQFAAHRRFGVFRAVRTPGLHGGRAALVWSPSERLHHGSLVVSV